MKKYLFFVLFTVVSLGTNAQNQSDGNYEFFIDVYLEWGGKNWIPQVQLGESAGEYLFNEAGDKLKFKGRSGVINYFTKLGWTFVQSVRHYNNLGPHETLYFKKQIRTEEEAKEGLLFEKDLKKK